MIKKDVIYIGICFVLFACMRFILAGLDTDSLKFLLTPTNKLIELLLSVKSEYITGEGYYYPQLDIIINKLCSGYNFWLIGFLLNSFVFIQSQKIKFLYVIPLAIAISYLVTILANVSRIAGYIYLINTNIASYIDPNDAWLHQAEGIFVDIFFLLLYYFTLNYTITKINKNEKTT